MSVTLLVPYSASGQENGGVKMDVPAQSADPGEPVRMYLWGRSREALDGYGLTQGAQRLGAGRLARYDGQTEMAVFDLDGSGALQGFTWPVLSLAAVVAVGRLYHVAGNAVSLIALPGEDVTRYFRLSGNALAAAEDMPILTGTVAATANRSPWCREWEWIAPQKPASGLPEGMCTDDEEDRDGAAYWFFLMRYGVLVEEFSLTLSEYNVNWGDEFDFGKEPLLWFDASKITADDGQVLTGVVDCLGNKIELNGIYEAYFVDDSTSELFEKEFLVTNGDTKLWDAGTGVKEPWVGPIPSGVKKEVTTKTSYKNSIHGEPCIRLESSCTKVKPWGLLMNGTASMNAKSTYSSSYKKTYFIIAAGKDAYKIGRDVNTDNFIPVGYSAREKIFINFSGDTTPDDSGILGSVHEKIGFGACGGTPTFTKGAQYNAIMEWTGPIPDGVSQTQGQRYIGQKQYPLASKSLLSLVVDAGNSSFEVFINGILSEVFTEVFNTFRQPFFPVDSMSLGSEVYFYNTNYDSMGVSYEAHIDIFTAILFEGHFDGTKRQDIEQYLMTKWGII